MSLFGSTPTASGQGSQGGGFPQIQAASTGSTNLFGFGQTNSGASLGANTTGASTPSGNTLGSTGGGFTGNSGSLFGSSTIGNTGASGSGGLFGSNTGATNSGLNTGTTTGTNTGGAPFGGGGLFGTNSNRNTSTNASTNSTSNPNMGQTGTGGSLFGSSTNQQNKQNQQNSAQPQATIELLPPLSTDKDTQNTSIFVELLEGAKNLPSMNAEYGEIIHDIREVKSRMQKIKDSSGSSDRHNTKAHYLLASSGINYEEISSRINRLIEKQYLEPRSKAFTTERADLDNFLRFRKEANILAAIDESVRFASKEYDWFLSQKLTIDWKQKKHEVYQHFGLATGGTGGTGGGANDYDKSNGNANQSLADLSALEVPYYWGKTTLGRKVLGPINKDSEFVDVQFYRPSSTGVDYITEPSNSIDGDSSGPQFQALITSAELRAKKFALVIKDLNDYRQADRPFPLAVNSKEVSEAHAADLQSQHITDSWKILSEIIGETKKSAIPSRHYRAMYQCKSAFDPYAINMRKRIVKGSKKYLNDIFIEYIDDSIAAAPEDARLGGIPSIVNRIKAFVQLKHFRAGRWSENLQLINGTPFWAMIYYMIRCGYYGDALAFTKFFSDDLDQVEADFLTYISNFVENDGEGLSPAVNERIRSDYQQRIANFSENTDDQFKYAVFQILGRCNLSRKSLPGGLTSTSEDWIWVQLMLAREGDPEDIFNSDSYNLLHIQTLVKENGATFFNPTGGNPGLLLKILVLCGLFEQAVMFCYSFSKPDAVQLAITLDYYGLLNVISDPESIGSRLALVITSDNTNDDDDWDDDELSLEEHYSDHHPQINFARLVGQYTKSFRRSDPRVAVDYLVLLTMDRDLPGKDGEEHVKMCHEALRELVLETREFAELLGDILSDGTRVAGAIEKRMSLININDSEVYLHTIAEQAAQKADEDGRTADAVLLYQLAEEYDTVVTLINRAVGEALILSELGQSLNQLPSGVPLLMAVSENPAQVARSLLATYKNNSSIVSQISTRNRETCESLLKIVDAREQFAQGLWDECLEAIEASQVMSIKAGTDMGTIRLKAQQFLTLHDSLARNIPSTLVMAMRSCVSLSTALQQSRFVTASTVFNSKNLKDVARNIMVYAGMIHYRMSRDTYSELTRLEALL